MSDEMRILTVRQPWAWAIMNAGKDAVDDDLEDPEHPMYGLVHKGCPDRQQFDHNRYSCAWCTNAEPRRWLDRGHFIGVVNLWAVHRDRHNGNCCPHRPSGGPGGSPWSERDAWHLCINDPRPLAEPIPFKGALGLRHLPANVVEQITASLR